MILSARPSRAGVTEAQCFLRFMINSTSLTCCTGRSAGFAPLSYGRRSDQSDDTNPSGCLHSSSIPWPSRTRDRGKLSAPPCATPMLPGRSERQNRRATGELAVSAAAVKCLCGSQLISSWHLLQGVRVPISSAASECTFSSPTIGSLGLAACSISVGRGRVSPFYLVTLVEHGHWRSVKTK
jgi:hypothetical protein